ncbi:MAG: hypothetical protein WA728_26725 [Xanthobacteraceae bacterium]
MIRRNHQTGAVSLDPRESRGRESENVIRALDSEVGGSVEQESSKPVQTAHTKVGIDAERIRSSIAKLTSSSTNELEKLVTELEALQEFLKSETRRVQGEIESILDGIKIIVEAITPWKTVCVAGEENKTRPNGRDRIKRWP